MKVYRRNGRYDYVEGNFRRSIHTLWLELTGEKILPIDRRAEAERLSTKIFALRHSQTRSDGVDVGYALPLYIERCRVKGLSERSIRQRIQQIRLLSSQDVTKNGDSVYIADTNVYSFTAAYIQRKLDALKCKGASRNRYLSTISSFLEFCKRSGYIRTNPAREVERYREVKEDANRIITPLIFEKLKGVSTPAFCAVMDIAYHTGLRRGEIHFLWTRDWVDVDIQTRWVTFPANAVKNRRSKVIPLRQEAVDAIRRLKLNRDRPYHSADGITLAFRRACNRAEVRFRFHDFRHTFVSRAMETLPPNIVAVLVGHTTPAVTQGVYTHFGADFLRKAVDSL